MPGSEPTDARPADVSNEGLALRQAVGVVGPNAVLQLIPPLRDAGGDALLNAVFNRARVFHYLKQPPQAMVPEEEVMRLFQATREAMSDVEGDVVLQAAGVGTARYVMAHRIPAVARGLLKSLPAIVAAPMLLNAIDRNAWTFAGSGRFEKGRAQEGWWITIDDNPLATPGCPWHVGVLQTMFQSLVSKASRVALSPAPHAREGCCRFEVRVR